MPQRVGRAQYLIEAVVRVLCDLPQCVGHFSHVALVVVCPFRDIAQGIGLAQPIVLVIEAPRDGAALGVGLAGHVSVAVVGQQTLRAGPVSHDFLVGGEIVRVHDCLAVGIDVAYQAVVAVVFVANRTHPARVNNIQQPVAVVVRVGRAVAGPVGHGGQVAVGIVYVGQRIARRVGHLADAAVAVPLEQNALARGMNHARGRHVDRVAIAVLHPLQTAGLRNAVHGSVVGGQRERRGIERLPVRAQQAIVSHNQ